VHELIGLTNLQVTVKPHPHLGLPYASIHPCRHADVMKKIVGNMLKLGKEPRADLYLFIFLKFLSAVIPSIEYDNTFNLDIPLYSSE
jgi:ubiquitin-like-conjugating enzyme ATG3